MHQVVHEQSIGVSVWSRNLKSAKKTKVLCWSSNWQCELLHKWLVFCFIEAKYISADSSGSSPVTRGNDQCLNFSLFFHSFHFIFLLAEGVSYHIQHTPPVYNWACAKLLNCMNIELLLCDKTNYAENWEHLHQYLPHIWSNINASIPQPPPFWYIPFHLSQYSHRHHYLH